METQVQQVISNPAAKQLYTSILRGEVSDKVQLFFLADVLNHYREQAHYSIIRTDTSGRLSKQGGWSIDFGISGERDEIIHTSLEIIMTRLPSSEHEHWLSALINLPLSANFIKGLVRPGCLDDGQMRKW